MAAASGTPLALDTAGHRLQGIPPDVIVHVEETKFSLHKFMLVAKSNYIRKLVLGSASADLSRIDLSDIPGGSETFEKAAKFCYGVNFEITVHNAAGLRCAAKYLEMTDEYSDNNLAGRTDDFLSQVAMHSLTGAIAVLKSCEDLLPVAEELSIVQKCVEIVSAKACVEANFQSHSPQEWWMDELSILGVAFFQRVVNAMKAKGTKGVTLASAIMIYAEKSLGELVCDHSAEGDKSLDADETDVRRQQRKLLEAIVALLPLEKSLFPINFSCCLLRTAMFLRAENGCRKELEKRISSVLEQATVNDLLVLSFTYDGDRLSDLESVKRIISGFVDKEKSVAVFNTGDVREVSTAMLRVAKTVDAYLGEIATHGELSIPKFNGIANFIPKEARKDDDNLYRAADIYLKAHKYLDELQREKVCSVMDPHKLSHQARVHASQNKRLPVQIVLHALYYDQLRVRSSVEDDHIKPNAAAMRNQVQVDVSLAKENEALRTELLNMKMYIQDKHKFTQETAPKNKDRQPTFLSLMSKTLGRWNPFNKNASKDTLSIDDGIVYATKLRRRFSIS